MSTATFFDAGLLLPDEADSKPSTLQALAGAMSLLGDAPERPRAVAASNAIVLEAFQQHYRQLVAHVAFRVGCESTAAGIVHDAYLRLCGSELPAHIENPRAFVFRVAANLAINHLRQEQFRGRHVEFGAVPEDVASAEPAAESRLADQELLAHMLAAVRELPPKCREVFVLRRFHQMKMEDIAAQLGVSLSMVEKHLRRAVVHCTMQLKAYEAASQGSAKP